MIIRGVGTLKMNGEHYCAGTVSVVRGGTGTTESGRRRA